MVDLYPRRKSKKLIVILVSAIVLAIAFGVYYLTRDANSQSGVNNSEMTSSENQAEDQEETATTSVDQIGQTLKDSQDSFSAVEDDLKNIESYQAENDSAPSI
jgi:flagellar basal body-associated protein FliL